MSQLPRKGQFELFVGISNTVYCFDDPEHQAVPGSEEMFKWLHSLPDTECRPFAGNAAFYLTPQSYLMWKLKWAYN